MSKRFYILKVHGTPGEKGPNHLWIASISKISSKFIENEGTFNYRERDQWEGHVYRLIWSCHIVLSILRLKEIIWFICWKQGWNWFYQSWGMKKSIHILFPIHWFPVMKLCLSLTSYFSFTHHNDKSPHTEQRTTNPWGNATQVMEK